MEMTLDKAIRHAEEVAEEQENLWGICPASESELFFCDGSKDCTVLANGKNKGCLKCAAEHRLLAKWLKDYKRLLLKDQGCETCKYQYTPIDDKFCKDCDGFSLWEAKDELNI